MANKSRAKTPIHVLSRDEGWAVVREGNERATSIHPTQAEAAEVGREIARKDGTVFLLHAKDGRIRDRSDYGVDSGPSKERPEGIVAGVASAATRATGGAVDLASGVVGGTVEGVGGAATGASQGAEQDASQGSGTPYEEKETDDAKEVGGLAYEQRYTDYEVYDRDGERLGKVDTLFLDEDDRLEYVGVKMGLLGTHSTLLPWAAVTREDQEGRRIEVAVDKETAENGPAFEDDQEITPELEREVYGHYKLERSGGAEDRGAYGDYYPDTEQTTTTTGSSDLGTTTGDTATGGLGEHHHGSEGLHHPGSAHEAEDEIRVRRSEEELVAGTREREAGALRVRKRVRTEHKTIEVPVRREEVHVERVPLSGETTAAGTEIGEEEIVVPVIEEEVVVSKRPVVKEEIRIRKDVVEDTEVVEEDVRREEIDIDDGTSTSRRDI
jgi:uncharacterized protein (TIGR02271 family)